MIAHPNLPVIVSEYEQKWVEGLNNGDVSVANEVFHHDCIVHINGNTRRDLTVEQFTEMVAGLFVAFRTFTKKCQNQAFQLFHKGTLNVKR